MSSLNKVMLIGRVGADPDYRSTQSGVAVTRFSMATSKKVKQENMTEWHKVVFFKDKADLVAKYCKKGDLIHVEGEIKTNHWEDKEGNKRSSVEIICHSVVFLGSREGQSNSFHSKNNPESDPDLEDDIPF